MTHAYDVDTLTLTSSTTLADGRHYQSQVVWRTAQEAEQHLEGAKAAAEEAAAKAGGFTRGHVWRRQVGPVVLGAGVLRGMRRRLVPSPKVNRHGRRLQGGVAWGTGALFISIETGRIHP